MNTDILLLVSMVGVPAADSPYVGLVSILFRATPAAGHPMVDTSFVSQPEGQQDILETTTRHPGRYETSDAPRRIIY
jgi:hypothetical protein